MKWISMLAALLPWAALAQVRDKQPPLPEADPAYRTSPGYRSYQRANALFIAQKFPECLGALEETLRLDPKLVPALTLKAKLAMIQNRYDVARQALEQAITVAPSAWYAQFLYGFHYYQQNEMQLATPPLEKARRLNPRDPRPALYLGLVEESLGRTAEAVALYHEAIRLEEAAGRPHSDTLLACSRLLLLLGRLEECGRLIDKALKLDPNTRDPHFESARWLLRKGDPAGAAKEGEMALRLSTGGVPDRQIHYLLLRAYQAAGRESEAARHAAALRSMEGEERK
jgi:tetratricopeptide (TPR) repeat protein